MEEKIDENQYEYLQETKRATRKILLEGWTREEKYTLLTSLKIHGSQKIQQIRAEIPNKTEEEIRSAIDFYRKRSLQNRDTELPKFVAKPRKLPIKAPRIPLAQWAKVLTDTLPYKDLQTETKDAIRLIATFETFPHANNTEQIDFRKVYHQIADAMEGKSLIDDKLITEVLNTCLIDSVLHSKAFINPKVLKFIINSINLENRDVVQGFNRPTKDCELATLRHLISQRNYNPLNIPEEYLTPSTRVMNE